jgi:hypothetical protein
MRDDDFWLWRVSGEILLPDLVPIFALPNDIAGFAYQSMLRKLISVLLFRTSLASFGGHK